MCTIPRATEIAGIRYYAIGRFRPASQCHTSFALVGSVILITTVCRTWHARNCSHFTRKLKARHPTAGKNQAVISSQQREPEAKRSEGSHRGRSEGIAN